jgi:hypothetical protein
MADLRNAVYRDLQWDGRLLLYLLGGNFRPMRDDLDVPLGNVPIGVDQQILECDNARTEQQVRRRPIQKMT